MITNNRRPYIRLLYDVKIDGKTVIRRRLAKSWVLAFTRLLYNQFSAGAQSVVDITGTTRSEAGSGIGFQCYQGADLSSLGVVIGSGTDAVTEADQSLQTLIETGSSSGQLRYMANAFNGPFSDSTTSSFQQIRTFVNNSGATVTVGEIGIYSKSSWGNYTYCIARDVLPSAVDVEAGKTLTITYTLSFAI